PAWPGHERLEDVRDQRPRHMSGIRRSSRHGEQPAQPCLWLEREERLLAKGKQREQGEIRDGGGVPVEHGGWIERGKRFREGSDSSIGFRPFTGGEVRELVLELL